MVVRTATRILIVPFLPLLIVLLASPASATIWEDAVSWEPRMGVRAVNATDGRLMWLCYLLAKCREFRTLVYYRLSRAGPGWRAAAAILRTAYRPQVALAIDCPDVGPRLFIEHGFCTTITAARVGSDCWINQNVTIGYGSKPGLPILEDRVYVRTGAVVAGPVRIAEGAHVGANSVVTRDVDPWTVVGGAPARMIGRVERR